MSRLFISEDYISKENAVWKLKCGDMRLSLGFDEKCGIAMESFENASGKRDVSYFYQKVSLLPVAVREDETFVSVSEEAAKTIFAGKEILTLKIQIRSDRLEYVFHLMAFPDTSVIRYHFDVTALRDGVEEAIVPLSYRVRIDDPKHIYTLSYFHGGRAAYDHGMREDFPMGTAWFPAKADISSVKTSEYVPLVLFKRNETPQDAFMVQMDYIANWSFTAQRNPMRQQPEIFSFSFSIDDGKRFAFKKGESMSLPVITLAVYAEDDDVLMERLYDWQYSYMWDYTNRDYYAKTRSISRWVSCTRNQHEQFAYRTAVISMGAVLLSRLGYDMLWDDAGWSACDGWPSAGYESVFFNNYEGPDFSQNRKFLKKCGKGWLLWFAGKPSPAVMEHKCGAWGNFEWRTDAVYLNQIDDERNFRNSIQTYLDRDPERSFHTCSGGSTYSHTFDIVRRSNYNYLADAGRGPATTYYFSYFEYPDKWGDLLAFLGPLAFTDDYATICPEADIVQNVKDVRYMPEFARAGLTAVPYPGESFCEEDERKVRTDLSLYRYFKENGIAGRYSYAYHPDVWGDKEFYYLQRTSRDRLRACIVLKHRPKKKVTIYPKAVLDETEYSVTFMNSAKRELRKGRDLKENGIVLERATDGELIFLNLDDHPKDEGLSAVSEEKTLNPFTVYKRRETNVGVSGVALYWERIGEADGFEIVKDGKKIDYLNRCNFYFERDGEEDSDYEVFGIKDNMRFACGKAEKIAGGKRIYSALGDYGRRAENSVWGAKWAKDGQNFEPMRFVPPADNPLADYGGTPNQIGGIMGYYEGGKCARVGHGWMQASSDCFAARTFICPRDGEIRVVVRAMKEWYHREEGCDLTFFVTRNGEPIGDVADIRKGDVYGCALNRRLTVKQGDELSFVLGKAEEKDEQPVPWEHGAALIGCVPVITYLEEDKTTGYYVKTQFEGSAEIVEKSFKVPVGIYKVCLKFSDEGKLIDENLTDVYINGVLELKELDVVQTSRGEGKCVRTVRYVVPRNGEIRVRIEAVKGLTGVNCIEIAEESDDVLRVNCGGEEFIDWSGDIWAADKTSQAHICFKDDKVFGATPTLFDRGLYLTAVESERIEYTFDLPNGLYFVHLKFMEDGNDSHAFEIMINGEKAYQVSDLQENAGGKRAAADRRFENVAVENGKLNILLKGIDGKKAILQAIEIGR